MLSFNNLCQKYNSVKLKIRYSWKGKKQEITLPNILPGKFCILAFHSVYAYILTLFNGGWFNWVNYDEDVIVNCPAPEGIAMYVRPSKKDSVSDFQVEVMKDSCKCYKGYKIKDSFLINFNEEAALKYEILDRIIPFFAKFILKECSSGDFSCGCKDSIIRYQIELDQ